MIEHMTKVKSITGKPFFAHMSGVIAMLLSPVSLASLSETVTINTFAVEPMCVPLPPIPTPNARHHQSAAAFMP